MSAKQIAELTAQVASLTKVIAEQAQAIARLTTPKAAPTVTIRELFAKYEGVRRKDHSWGAIRNRLLPLVEAFGDLPVMELTPRLWAEHLARRKGQPVGGPSKRGRKADCPSETTLGLETKRAKTMFRWASHPEQGLIASNPLAAVKTPKGRHRETALTEIELAKVLEHASPALRAFVLCCADSGLRLNEARHLRRDWIRPNGAVTLPRELTKSRKTRLVVLTPRALAAIREIPATSEEQPQIFCNPATRQLYAPSTLWRMFRIACEAAGIDQAVVTSDVRFRIHDLRHTAATAAVRRGAPIMAVQQMLGHANLSTTSGYLHASEVDALDLARVMHEGAERESRTAEVA